MAFQQFIPINKGVNTKDTYSIQAGTKKTGYFSGMIYFNGGMRDNLELDNYKFVDLFTDKENQLIAVKFTNSKSDASRALRKNGNHYFITCSSWLYVAVNDLGYPKTGSGSYELLVGGLVVLNKPEQERPTQKKAEEES